MYSLGSAEMLDFFGDVFGAASGCGGRFVIGWDSFWISNRLGKDEGARIILNICLPSEGRNVEV